MRSILFCGGGFLLRLEIGFIPHKWISDIPDACGYFPFAIEGETENIVDFTFSGNCNIEEFVSNWMNEINHFPIYIFVEVCDYNQKEFEQDCQTYNIEFVRAKFGFYKAIIENCRQFSVIFPYVYASGGMNDVALWSLKRDVFRLEKRDINTIWGIKKLHIPVVTLLKNDCVFWVSFDAASLFAISNGSQFSTITKISEKLPPKTHFIISEYEE